MTSNKIGIVLSSGGVRGVFGHTGFLLALDKLGIPVSAMAGCSAGAVVGAILASGGDIRGWSNALKEVSVSDFWRPRNKFALITNALFHKGAGLLGLSGSTAAAQFVSKHLGAGSFENCKFPFYAVAINIGNGDKVIFNSNELAPRVIASAAMPVFYEPVEIDGEFYSDGASVDFAPYDAICCKHGLDKVIIHHLANRDYNIEQLRASFNKPWSIAVILHRLIYHHKPWYVTGNAISRHSCPCGCKAEIIVLEPDLPDLMWPLTKGGADIINSSEKQALSSLRTIFDL